MDVPSTDTGWEVQGAEESFILNSLPPGWGRRRRYCKEVSIVATLPTKRMACGRKKPNSRDTIMLETCIEARK